MTRIDVKWEEVNQRYLLKSIHKIKRALETKAKKTRQRIKAIKSQQFKRKHICDPQERSSKKSQCELDANPSISEHFKTPQP